MVFLLCAYAGVLYIIGYVASIETDSSSGAHTIGKFPVLSGSKSIAYRKYKKAYVSLVSSLPFGFISIIFFFTRIVNIKNVSWPESPLFRAGFVCGIASVLSYISFLLVYAMTYCHGATGGQNSQVKTHNGLSSSGKVFVFIRKSFLGPLLQEIAAISGVFCVGFTLYGRVVAGACVEGTMYLDRGNCNPMATVHGLPPDHLQYYMMMPAVFPIVVRAIRFETVIFTWFVCVFFTMISMTHVGGDIDWITMVLMGIPLGFVFEGERLSRLSFLNLELIEAKSKADVEKAKTDADRQSEKELAVRERKQLVSLIGNVAHDLKTPLQSFKMDIEFLRKVVKSLFVCTTGL